MRTNMKKCRTAASLLLLCGIICGCAVMGMQAEALPEEQGSGVVIEESAPPAADGGGGQSLGVSATVEKVYSEGLKFRSNGDGTCALAGIGSCTAASVLIPPTSPAGDTVKEILPYALVGSIVRVVELPATVDTVSAASFAGCASLSLCRVAAGNEALLEFDGALYTADGGTLIYCPAARSTPYLQLHESLGRVAAGAFAECRGLDEVVFIGNTAKWQAVIVGDDNDALFAAGFRFVAK